MKSKVRPWEDVTLQVIAKDILLRKGLGRKQIVVCLVILVGVMKAMYVNQLVTHLTNQL